MRFFISLCSAFFILWLMPQTVRGQQVQRCHTMEYLEELKKIDPGLEARMEQARNQAAQYLQNKPTEKRGQRAIITIPVVVHVMNNGEAIGTGANISDAQVFSQFVVLNEDYKALNSDLSGVPVHFAGIVGDVQLEFCLAQIDPEGNPTNGIDRVDMGSGSWSDNQKPGTVWDASQYLNLWTASISGGVLGYATFPGTSPTSDGVVIDYRYFGKAPENPFNSNFDLGRTASHEIGHWLGLDHTFQGGCSGTSATTCATQGDRICDTPPTASANYGCNISTNHNTCTETPTDLPDMWMNFLDYMDDACLFMFTQDQADEMRAVLNTSRSSILASLACSSQNIFSYSGKVADAQQTGFGVGHAKVLFVGTGKYEVETDNDGNFTSPNFREGTYAVYAGKWGYMTNQFSANSAIDSTTASLVIPIQNHFYYDDFIMDYGWAASGNAVSGLWERGIPIGTSYNGNDSNPGEDVTGDFGDNCFVTGNGGGSAGNDDVDDGNVVINSPLFDLSGYNEPYLSYYRWFFNGGGQGNPDDLLIITLSNGTESVTLETIDVNTENTNQWTLSNFRVKDFITPTSTMQFSLETADQSGTGHLVEAGLDLFQVVDSLPSAVAVPDESKIFIYPNPANDAVNIQFNFLAEKAQLLVSDVSGKLITEKDFSPAEKMQKFDVSNLADGVYIFRLTAENNYILRKVTVIH